MRQLILITIFSTSIFNTINAQTVGIGENTNPNSNAVLDINSNFKGVLFPKLSPGTISIYESTLGPNDGGMFVFNIYTNQYMYFKSPADGFVNLSNKLFDTDNDTGIEVEETKDEDKIKFYVEDKLSLTIEKNDFAQPIYNIAKTNIGNLLFANQLPIGSGGNDNTYFGQRDSTIEIMGDRNAAFGYNSLNSNTTGGENTAIGWNALRFNQDGFGNVAVGGNALANNTTGVGNTAIGAGSLDSLISGNSNVAIGVGTLRKLSSSDNNVGVGTGTLTNLESGSLNVVMGGYAMYNLQQGTENVAIGYNSGFGASSNNRSRNTFIGAYAGQNNNGDGNVFIGRNAGRNFDTSDKLIISTTAASNSLIYGDFGSAKLGIFWDYDDPLPARLSVNGDVYIEKTLQLKPQAFAPTCNTDKEGLIYYNSNNKTVNVCVGTGWEPLN